MQDESVSYPAVSDRIVRAVAGGYEEEIIESLDLLDRIGVLSDEGKRLAAGIKDDIATERMRQRGTGS